MPDPNEIQRIRNEARHGFAYTLPRTALNDVETLLSAYDAEKQRRVRYQVSLQSIHAWAKRHGNRELLDLLAGHLGDFNEG